MNLSLLYLNLRSSEIHLFYNLGDFYWHFLEILWLFIFLFLYSFSLLGFCLFIRATGKIGREYEREKIRKGNRKIVRSDV